MRSNGLTAADYAPLAVVERSVAADALLALREAGVAAYAVRRTTESEDDQARPEQAALFADRRALERARAVVRELAPDAVSPSVDPAVDEVAWQQIVSGFSTTAPEPDTLDLAPGEQTTPPADRGPHDAPADHPHPLVRDEDDHFVPDPAWPPPPLDWVSRAGWAGVLGGPLLLLAATLMSWSPPSPLVLVCVMAFVGGVTTLVWRMKDRPPTDDGPDDGAVV
jgi:hypothetical protein